jgi:hypothetical protein
MTQNSAMFKEPNPVMVEAFGSEDDAHRCVDFMRPKLQAYLDDVSTSTGQMSKPLHGL